MNTDNSKIFRKRPSGIFFIGMSYRRGVDFDGRVNYAIVDYGCKPVSIFTVHYIKSWETKQWEMDFHSSVAVLEVRRELNPAVIYFLNDENGKAHVPKQIFPTANFINLFHLGKAYGSIEFLNIIDKMENIRDLGLGLLVSSSLDGAYNAYDYYQLLIRTSDRNNSSWPKWSEAESES